MIRLTRRCAGVAADLEQPSSFGQLAPAQPERMATSPACRGDDDRPPTSTVAPVVRVCISRPRLG